MALEASPLGSIPTHGMVVSKAKIAFHDTEANRLPGRVRLPLAAPRPLFFVFPLRNYKPPSTCPQAAPQPLGATPNLASTRCQRGAVVKQLRMRNGWLCCSLAGSPGPYGRPERRGAGSLRVAGMFPRHRGVVPTPVLSILRSMVCPGKH